MATKKAKTQQLNRLTARAVKKYGRLKKRKVRSPLDQLVLSMLCRYASVRRATRALRQLKRDFVDWNEVRISSTGEIAISLSGAQWAGSGSHLIKNILTELFEVRNEVSLEFLHNLTPFQSRRYLQSLPQVERWVADEVILFSLKVPVMPCSPDTARMCHRLGILDSPQPTAKNQRILTDLVEQSLHASLHMLFSDSAGQLCLPKEPQCKACFMKRHCPEGKN